MPIEKFLIAPLESGQQNNFKPWLLMENAFEDLKNLYTWRGSIKKRFGGRIMNDTKTAPQDQLFTRLRIKIGTTNGIGDLTVTPIPGAIFKIGQMFSVGDELLTVLVLGAPAVLLVTGASFATLNTNNGNFILTGSTPLTDVYFYPSEPVMNFASYDITNINDEDLFAFDTQFAYKFIYTTGWDRVAGGADTWTGTNSDFYSITNYRGATSSDLSLFITNGIIADGFRYWDGATFGQLGTLATTPINNTGTDYLITGKVIINFKDSLLMMNTTENIGINQITFINRIRYTAYRESISITAWNETIPGGGSFIDIPVSQAIIGAEYLKDRLIIFLERSTWELIYTGNPEEPFTIQQLDSNLGVESQNSIIQFDRNVMGFGSNGIHSCNGVNVERIDQLVPDVIFDVSNINSSQQRIAGIRDFKIEMVYWSYQSIEEQGIGNNIFPNRVLVFDYVNQTWAYNDDSITAFGSFFIQKTILWQDLNTEWYETEYRWHDNTLQDTFRSIIAGNQCGFTFIVDTEKNTNSISNQITNVTFAGSIVTILSIDHNIADGDYVFISDIQADATNMNTDGIINKRIFEVSIVDRDSFTIEMGEIEVTGNYTGGGVFFRVSNPNLLTKQYNFYNKIGTNIAVIQADFLVDSQAEGQVTVNWYVSSSNQNLTSEAAFSGTLLGTQVLETSPYALVPLEATQDRFWHSIYFNATGENFQLNLSLSPEQIIDPNIAFSGFQLNAIIFYVTKTNMLGG